MQARKLFSFPSSYRFLVFITLFALLIAGLSSYGAPGGKDGSKRGGAALPKQPEGQPAPEILPLWKEFAARSGAPIGVSWNEGTGTPQSIYGKLSESVGVATEVDARRFLSDNHDLFKMPASTYELTLVSSFDSPMGRHFVFEQNYQGLPIFGAEVKVHFNQAGEVVAVNNTYVPDIYLPSAKPRVSGSQAVVRARESLPAVAAVDSVDLPEPATKLGIYVSKGAASLAWEVLVSTSGPTWKVVVDADKGGLLAAPADINRYVTGSGQVFNVNAVVATQDNTLVDSRDRASAVPSSAYSLVTLQGLAGNGFLDGDFASSSTTRKRVSSATNTFVFDRSSDGFSETMGYYSFDFAQRYIQSLGFTNVNNRQQVFSVNTFKQDNSFYSPSTKRITLGEGGVDDAEDAEVIWHEYGHSIQDNQVPGFGSTLEAGSMGEGFGDYWAGSVGAQLSGGFQDLCIADWDAVSYSSTNPPCLRRLDGTKHYPEDVQGEVHRDGEMWSAALWEIRGAIGATKADKVILQAHFLLSPNASFSDGSNALVTAAMNLGYTPPEVNAIRNILLARGFTVTV